jgi:hypothetical protein
VAEGVLPGKNTWTGPLKLVFPLVVGPIRVPALPSRRTRRTCRDEILEAFEVPRYATTREAFTVREVYEQMVMTGTGYSPTTVRMTMTYRMAEESPGRDRRATGELKRVGPNWFGSR